MNLNLDTLEISELEDFIQKCNENKQKFVKELSISFRDLGLLHKYAQASLEAIQLRLDGHIDKAIEYEILCNNIYRSLSDEVKW